MKIASQNFVNTNDPKIQYAIEKCGSYLDIPNPIEYTVALKKKRFKLWGKSDYKIILENKGDKSSAGLPKYASKLRRAKNTILIHGHPELSDGRTMGIGVGDYRFGAVVKADEVIAVSKKRFLSQIKIPKIKPEKRLYDLSPGDWRDFYFDIVKEETPESVDKFIKHISKKLNIGYKTHKSFFERNVKKAGKLALKV